MLPNLNKIADLVAFTDKILDGKLHFLCSDHGWTQIKKFRVSGAGLQEMAFSWCQ